MEPNASGAEKRERFKEVVEYALERLSTGGTRVSHRRLAIQLQCAPGMIRRYVDLEVDVHGLRYISILRLAEASRLDPGAIFKWIEVGREEAMSYQSSINQSLEAYTALDLAHRLVQVLDIQQPKTPSAEPLKELVDQLESLTGPLFTRMVTLAGACAVVERVRSGELPSGEEWDCLGELLEIEPEELKRLAGMQVAIPC